MNNRILLAAVCLALGASIVWIVWPDPALETAQTESDEKKSRSGSTKSSVIQTNREKRSRTLVESDRDPDAPGAVPMDDDARQRADLTGGQVQQEMKKFLKTKFDTRMENLVAGLGLTPAQEAALRNSTEERIAGSGELEEGNYDPAKLRELMMSDGLDEILADILTPEQKVGHEEFKKRQVANQVEAQALKDFAKLSDLDLSQEQKDDAYDVLYELAAEDVSKESPLTAARSIMSDLYGLEMGGNTPEQIEKKVEAMRPILSESQLDQYREGLQNKSNSFRKMINPRANTEGNNDDE